MKPQTLLNLLAIGVLACLIAGCSTTNKNQVAETTSGDGVYGKVGIPLGSSLGSLGLQGFIGRFNNTTAVNPTSSNQLYAASVGVAVAGQGARGVTGIAGTNGAAGVTDKGGDSSILILGATSAGTDTNHAVNVQGQR